MTLNQSVTTESGYYPAYSIGPEQGVNVYGAPSWWPTGTTKFDVSHAGGGMQNVGSGGDYNSSVDETLFDSPFTVTITAKDDSNNVLGVCVVVSQVVDS